MRIVGLEFDTLLTRTLLSQTTGTNILYRSVSQLCYQYCTGSPNDTKGFVGLAYSPETGLFRRSRNGVGHCGTYIDERGMQRTDVSGCPPRLFGIGYSLWTTGALFDPNSDFFQTYDGLFANTVLAGDAPFQIITPGGTIITPGGSAPSTLFRSRPQFQQVSTAADLTSAIQVPFMAPVPLPAGLPLLLGALGIIGLVRRRSGASPAA